MPSRILVITGMHRSGTSWVASIASALEINVGERLVQADSGNPFGYFEDIDLLEMNRTVLRASVPSDAPGHPDWGWTESESFDRARWYESYAQAQSLVQARAGLPYWGWKDPRTSVLLDFWDGVLPADARYVLLYRFPWEIEDSMQRLGADVFLRHPDYASRIWRFYNRHMLDFYRRHVDRCLLINTNALTQQPNRLAQLLRSKFKWDLAETRVDNLFRDGYFRGLAPDDPLIYLFAKTQPECLQMLTELENSADLNGRALWQIKPPQSYLRPDTPCAPKQLPRLSVVIPCYNQGDYIIDAVASVQRHAPSDCEIIIVNDGSTQPRTIENLGTLQEMGYFVLNQENAGLSAARNAGIRSARGEYLLPLDADDRLQESFLDAAIQILDTHSDVGVVYTDWQDFGGRSICHHVSPFTLEELAFKNQLGACAVLRRQVWSDCGGYDLALYAFEDWDLWINALKRGWQFWHLPGVGYQVRVHPDSMLARLDQASEDRLFIHLLKKHNALSPVTLIRHIFEMRDRAAEQNRLIQSLVAQVGERQNAVESLTGQLAAQTDEVNRLVGQFGERQQAVESLVAQLDAQTEKINTLVAQVGERQQAVDSLVGQLAVKEQMVEVLTAQLSEQERTMQAISRNGNAHQTKTLNIKKLFHVAIARVQASHKHG